MTRPSLPHVDHDTAALFGWLALIAALMLSTALLGWLLTASMAVTP